MGVVVVVGNNDDEEGEDGGKEAKADARWSKGVLL